MNWASGGGRGYRELEVQKGILNTDDEKKAIRKYQEWGRPLACLLQIGVRV